MEDRIYITLFDVLNFGVFVLYSILASIVLVSIDFKTDFSVKVSILIFWLCSVTRCITLLFNLKA